MKISDEPALSRGKPESGGEPGIKPMFDDDQMRRLKRAVIGMGVVLLLGFALVIGRIVYLLNRTSVDTAIASSTSPATTPADLKLALPAGAIVRNLSLSGNRLAVHYDAPSGGGIAVVDLATGKTTQKIELAPAR